MSMMKRFTRIFAICCITAVCGALSPQDVSAQSPDHPWLGWYGGALTGISWTDGDVSLPSGSTSNTYTGVVGGGVVGNNFFLDGNTLFGFEADFVLNDVTGDFSLSRHRVSLVARAGQFVTPNLLFFAVAGLTGGQYRAEVTATSTTTMTILVDEEIEQTVTTTTTASSNREKRLWGFTVGAGFETNGQIAGVPVRWGLEYRFSDFNGWDFMVAGQPFGFDPQVHDARFRIVVPF